MFLNKIFIGLLLVSEYDSLLLGEERARLFQCTNCVRAYKHKFHLNQHLRYECNQEPQFACSICAYKAHRKSALQSHYLFKHNKCNKPL